MASCDYCGLHFANRYQLGPHKRKCSRQRFLLSSDTEDFTQESDSENAADRIVLSDRAASPVSAAHPACAAVTQAVVAPVPSLPELASRPRGWGVSTEIPRLNRQRRIHNPQLTHDYMPVCVVVLLRCCAT